MLTEYFNETAGIPTAMRLLPIGVADSAFDSLSSL